MTTMDIIRRTRAAWRSIHTMTAEDKSRLLQSRAESLQRHTSAGVPSSKPSCSAAIREPPATLSRTSSALLSCM